MSVDSPCEVRNSLVIMFKLVRIRFVTCSLFVRDCSVVSTKLDWKSSMTVRCEFEVTSIFSNVKSKMNLKKKNMIHCCWMTRLNMHLLTRCHVLEPELSASTSQSCFELSLCTPLHTDVCWSQLERRRRPLLKIALAQFPEDSHSTQQGTPSRASRRQWQCHKQCAPPSCPPRGKRWNNNFSRPPDTWIQLGVSNHASSRLPGQEVTPATPRTVRAFPFRTVLPRSSV